MSHNLKCSAPKRKFKKTKHDDWVCALCQNYNYSFRVQCTSYLIQATAAISSPGQQTPRPYSSFLKSKRRTVNQKHAMKQGQFRIFHTWSSSASVNSSQLMKVGIISLMPGILPSCSGLARLSIEPADGFFIEYLHFFLTNSSIKCQFHFMESEKSPNQILSIYCTLP